MATRLITQHIRRTSKQALDSALSHPFSPFYFRPLVPFVAVAADLYQTSVATRVRNFATTCQTITTSSLGHPKPNWSELPPDKSLPGMDLEHWLVVMERPEGDPSRDGIIDSYIKTLAQVVSSEDEARMKIYSVSTRFYFAFGALVSEDLSHELKKLPGVRWVFADSYLYPKTNDYGGEPFINGKAVPYDPNYHKEWVRNNWNAERRTSGRFFLKDGVEVEPPEEGEEEEKERAINLDRSINSEGRRSEMANEIQGLDMQQTLMSHNDPNPNLNPCIRLPSQSIVSLAGCDFEHWLVIMEKPGGEPTRDEIIGSYIKTLAKVVGSEYKAGMKIYSIHTEKYNAFGALVSEEFSDKLKKLPGVQLVVPDCYVDIGNKRYGGEPFIDGNAFRCIHKKMKEVITNLYQATIAMWKRKTRKRLQW